MVFATLFASPIANIQSHPPEFVTAIAHFGFCIVVEVQNLLSSVNFKAGKEP